ncbi:12316_t:CDS:1, partial [Gigaspora margarita]
FLENGKFNAALIEIETKNLRRRKELIVAWAIYFEEGKMIKVTQKEFDKETLIEHSKNKMIVKNVSKIVAEATLLRQLKSINAKAVYISLNRNGNQRNMITMYFSSDKECQDAVRKAIYYYYTKLEWATDLNESGRTMYSRKEHIKKSVRIPSATYRPDKENI